MATAAAAAATRPQRSMSAAPEFTAAGGGLLVTAAGLEYVTVAVPCTPAFCRAAGVSAAREKALRVSAPKRGCSFLPAATQPAGRGAGSTQRRAARGPAHRSTGWQRLRTSPARRSQ